MRLRNSIGFQILAWSVGLGLALTASPAQAANLTLSGAISSDDAVQLFDFTVATPSSVDLRSYGYAGGTSATGRVVASGGFDTTLTLFDSSGNFLNENDDGAGVATDPTTGLAGDARITQTLAAGNYLLALTQYDNFARGNLPDGFAETGNPNFTAASTFTSGGPCPGNMFRDISGTDGRCRTGNWTVDFVNVASATAVPEPSALVCAGVGLALLFVGRLRNRRKATLVIGGLVAALATGPSLFAQSGQNPDFTNVNDILHGNRTLLQITDVEIISSGPETGDNVIFYQLPMSNSSPGQTPPPFQLTLVSPPATVFKPLELSGWIFNLPRAVTVQMAATDVSDNAQVQYSVQNAGIDPNFNVFSIINGPQSPTNGVVSDFNGDGYDDIALEYDDGSYQILTATDVNQVYVPFSQDPLKAGPTANLDVLTRITAGNFDGKGHREIAGLEPLGDSGGPPFNHLGLVVYTVNPSTLQIQPAYSKPFVLTTPGASVNNPITQVSIARGQFNTTSHDQIAVTFSMLSGPSIVEIVDFDSALNPMEGPQLTVSKTPVPEGIYTGYIQVTTGKFAPGNPYDQIVFHQSSTTTDGDKFFEVLSVNPTDLTLTAHKAFNYGPCAAYNGIQVGNFDNQQPGGQHNLSSQIALLACSSDQTTSILSIYSVDPQTFDVHGSPDSSLNLSTQGPLAPHSSFVATDIQGRSLVLGEPTKVTIDYTNSTIINAMPPMHVDYITPVGGSKPEVLNISFIPDGFNSSFSLSQESKTGASTTGKTSWSAGVDLSVGGSYQIGDPDEGTGTRFSEAFHIADDITGSSSNSNINYTGSKFDVTTATKKGDVVFYNDYRQNIWVYPALGQKVCPATLPNCSADQQVPLTIQFSGPDQIDTEITSTEDAGAYWYQPPWEFANVLSYPATKNQLALIYPDLASTQLSSDVSFKPTQSSVKLQAVWSSGTEQGSTSSLADTLSFDNTISGTTRWGISKIVTGSFNASLKLSGSVGFKKLQTNTAQIDSSNGIGILSTANFPDTSNYGYKVAPFILGNYPPSGVGDSQQPPQANIQTFGPLKTAFTADPLDPQQGGSWWSQTSAYRSAPDVALNHPNRWVVSYPTVPPDPYPANCANTGINASQINCVDIAPYYGDNQQPISLWTSDFFSMRGFFITSADNPGAGPQLGFATAGDKLDLAVRVYNYSLLPMPSGTVVHVRFYALPWDQLNNAPSGDPNILIGESKVDPIPPFNDTTTDLNWRLVHAPVPFDTTPYAGKWFTFWVVVWMEDSNGSLVKEIEGHGLKSIPSTLTQPADVPLEMAHNTQGQLASYSNNVGFYHYAFPVLAKPNQLGAPPPANPEEITLKAVTAAKNRIHTGEMDEITAVLRAGAEGASRLKVYFYDGDPDVDGKLISTQIAQFEPRTITKVRIPYYGPSDGVYRIWAVINKGQPYQTVRHTAAILVGNAVDDGSNSDGDQATNDSKSMLRSPMDQTGQKLNLK